MRRGVPRLRLVQGAAEEELEAAQVSTERQETEIADSGCYSRYP